MTMTNQTRRDLEEVAWKLQDHAEAPNAATPSVVRILAQQLEDYAVPPATGWRMSAPTREAIRAIAADLRSRGHCQEAADRLLELAEQSGAKRAPRYTKEQLIELFRQRPRAVQSALLQIYRRQTAAEQTSGQTLHHNGIGFSGFDAQFLSSVAEQVLRKQQRDPHGFHLSERQVSALIPKLACYHRQLSEIADEIEAAKRAARRLQLPPQLPLERSGVRVAA